jgi:FixJ family two-component response regulator
MLTGHGTVEMAIEGMKLGAFDFLMKPCETEDLTAKIDKAHDRKAEQEDRIRTAKINSVQKIDSFLKLITRSEFNVREGFNR